MRRTAAMLDSAAERSDSDSSRYKYSLRGLFVLMLALAAALAGWRLEERPLGFRPGGPWTDAILFGLVSIVLAGLIRETAALIRGRPLREAMGLSLQPIAAILLCLTGMAVKFAGTEFSLFRDGRYIAEYLLQPTALYLGIWLAYDESPSS